MALGYLVAAVLAATVAVFALQNTGSVAVRFVVWVLPSISVAALTLLALAAGLVVAGLPLWFRSWRLESRVRALERQVRQLETALEERNRAPMTPPSDPRADRAPGAP